MTMAFAVVALSAVNLGLVMRREREPPWSAPVFPYLGWIILGWALTWAAVELAMLPAPARHRVPVHLKVEAAGTIDHWDMPLNVGRRH